MKIKGFTFIELIIGVGILAMMATVGSTLFMRSLQGSSQIELRKNLDGRARLLLDGMGRFLREGEIISLDGQAKIACLASGSLSGDLLVVKGLDGLSSSFYVTSGLLSSQSAQTIVLNPESVTLDYKTGLTHYFTWYCSRGAADRLVMEFSASSTGEGGDSSTTSEYDLDVVSRNSSQ